jgi:hypothetical protein
MAMDHWSPAAVLVPLFILLLTPLFFLFVHGISKQSQHSALSDDYCESLLWTDIPDSEVLHDIKYLRQYSQSPEHGKRCWDGIFSQVFNKLWKKSKRRVQSARRPKQLGTRHQYLRIDLTALQALILICAVDEGPKRVPDQPNKFSYGGVAIEDIQTLDEDGDSLEEELSLASAHIVAASPQRSLAKLEVDRLIEGFPPWFYKDTFTVHTQLQPYTLPTPIHHVADLARGGWIIALGLTTADPLPLYYDHPWEVYDPSYDKQNFRTRRGGYFWQSIIFLHDTIRDVFAPAFPDEPLVTDALKTIAAMIKAESDTPEPESPHRKEFHTTPTTLTREQCEFAIDTFNSPSDALAIRRFLGKALVPVLAAAVNGVEKALRYVKEPGRELNSLIPAPLRDSEAIFLRDCEVGDK